VLRVVEAKKLAPLIEGFCTGIAKGASGKLDGTALSPSTRRKLYVSAEFGMGIGSVAC